MNYKQRETYSDQRLKANENSNQMGFGKAVPISNDSKVMVGTRHHRRKLNMEDKQSNQGSLDFLK